ncbi:FMN phosphatase YigB (HAD superfamily) [Nocardiopsis metallicus]|uniref:FMN phosphatase YigB (HAD superfamily) n=1 Tax=Nocardiopsis metallicus TaxID=179819 RepID=A0A840WH32_9ACTN|nr:FMN phosphatase YigB (HAD superfamily) [Nocardiopsis metallicus]
MAVTTLVVGYHHALTTASEQDFRPHSGHLRQVLAEHDITLSEAARADFDRRLVTWQRLAHASAMADLITMVLSRHGIDQPLSSSELAVQMCERAGDAPVTAEAARTLTRLLEQGYGVLVATTTCRPQEQRAKALADAGLGDVPLVTSSQLGVAAPHPEFYEHVLRRCAAAPGRVLWVGSDPIEDVAGPRAHGMHAAAVLPTTAAGRRERAARAGAHTVLTSLQELPDVLVPLARP